MTTGLHIYRCLNPKRVRRLCPHHKQLEYGELQEFYDTTRVFFDCGAFADYGYGYYEPPHRYKRLVIFWDNEVSAYRLFARYFWEELFSSTNHKRVLHVAQARLKPNGRIEDCPVYHQKSKEMK